MSRKLTITIRKDWRSALRETGSRATAGVRAGKYQGEMLNFETPAAFFSQLSEKRWALLETVQKAGESIGVRELARRLERDVKRVHEDAAVLVELGLLEKADTGALSCPYSDIHVDIHMMHAA